jgi:hypothetical protein
MPSLCVALLKTHIMQSFIIFTFLVCGSASTFAQVDTIYSIPQKWIQQNLKERTSQYLVFFQIKDKPKQAGVFIWSRQLRTKGTTIEIEQKWYSSDSASYRYLLSTVDKKSFLPLYHKTISPRSGTEAYNFTKTKIVGADSVKNNTKTTFELDSKQPLNWELDLETISLLDLKAGKRFAIYFYHPGGRSAPAFYEYKVTGSEVLTSFEGVKIDCWKLRIDFSPKYYAIFFISKKGREVIKMEEDFGQGVRYKVLLPGNIAVR